MKINGLKVLKPLAILILFFASNGLIYSQTKSTFDKAAITQEAKTQLGQMTSEAGELNAFAIKNEIKGEFVCDLTLQGKGDVLTVYMASTSSDDIAKKNLLKDKLHALRFENIKIPKKEKIKFRHTFTF